MIKTYVADFETTTTEENCHVWAYAICDVSNRENVIIGTTIDDFMHWCESQKDNVKVFFHNLKFDSQFIMYWCFKNGYKHVEETRDRESKTFTTLISDKGLYYSMEVVFYKKGKKINKVVFQDSLKLIPLSVDAIAKSFKLPIQKLSIDYAAHNDLPEGSPLSPIEEEYIKHDVQIVAYAIEYFYNEGLDKMTIGACALEEYQKLIQKRNFKRYFPEPTYDEDVRQSYKGGFTYLNPKFAGKIIKHGVVLDVNSLYPSVMRYEYLPYGTPIYFKGKYKPDEMYPLYVQMFRCQFKIKPGKIPTIQLKHSIFFKGTEYITDSEGERTLCLTSVDLELFYEQYDVFNEEWFSGWKFKGTLGLFDEYIDKWSNNKIDAKEKGNHGLYLISKLFLNSLYGKFGAACSVRSKIPFFDEDEDTIKFTVSDYKPKSGIYIAMASFITAYARRKTITAAQKVTDDYNNGISNIQFVYADTDSLHCYSPDFELPKGLDISPTKLGAWKYESKFKRGKFLRAKCYIEESTEDIYEDNPEFELKITVAGMPSGCYDQVTFSNFKLGASYTGKMQPKNVKGGVILKSVDYTIKK